MDKQTEKTFNLKMRVINVVIQPSEKHDKENYVKLIEKVFSQGNSFVTSNDKITKMRSLNAHGDMRYGVLINYTSRKDDALWYDSADDKLVNPQLDPNLNPNAKEWEFYFDAESHKIGIPSKKGVSFPQVTKFFISAFNKAAEPLGFDGVVVNVVSSQNGIDAIFGLEEVDSLTVQVSYSNNDTNEESDQLIDDEMKEQNFGTVKAIVKSPSNGKIRLKVKSWLGSLVRLSKNNGYVKAEGRKEGRVQKINTDQYPRILSFKKLTENTLIGKISDAFRNLNDNE